jgi:hypothetical protein
MESIGGLLYGRRPLLYADWRRVSAITGFTPVSMAKLLEIPINRNGTLGQNNVQKPLFKLIAYRFGSILALAVKLFLRSTVWIAYTQFLWKTLKKHPISISGFNAALSAPDSFRSLLNWDMIRVLKLGFGLALIAW